MLWFSLHIYFCNLQLKFSETRQIQFQVNKNNSHVDFSKVVVKYLYALCFIFLFSLQHIELLSGYIYVILTIDDLNALIAWFENIKNMFNIKTYNNAENLLPHFSKPRKKLNVLQNLFHTNWQCIEFLRKDCALLSIIRNS